jgi:hypothetical protein
VAEPVRVSGGVSDVAGRARRWWPIGLVVAIVTAIVGLAMTWETPRVFVTRATVFPPSSVTTALAGQRYINDLQAAINSFPVQRDVADELGVPRSAFGEQVQIRRVKQSTVMEAVLQSPDKLTDPTNVLERLVARAGQSLAEPDVAATTAELERAKQAVTTAEDAAVDAKKARDMFLEDRDGVPPAAELDLLAPELAELRLCAQGVVVPPGGDAAACRNQLRSREATWAEVAQAADELAALDREQAQAESDVTEAEREQRDADAAAARAGAGPVTEVSTAGKEISQVPSLLRRSFAIIGGALLLGFAVVVALALLTHPEQRSGRSSPGKSRDDADRPKRASVP